METICINFTNTQNNTTYWIPTGVAKIQKHHCEEHMPLSGEWFIWQRGEGIGMMGGQNFHLISDILFLREKVK